MQRGTRAVMLRPWRKGGRTVKGRHDSPAVPCVALSLALGMLTACHGHVRADRPAADALRGINDEIPPGTLATEALGTLHRLKVTDIAVGPGRPGSGDVTVISGRLPTRDVLGRGHEAPVRVVELAFDEGGHRRAAHIITLPPGAAPRTRPAPSPSEPPPAIPPERQPQP